MAQPSELPVWIALFLGLYLLAAGVAELRAPGGRAAIMAEWAGAPALRLLTGLVLFAIGAAIYLASPWQPGDWLSVAVCVAGGITLAIGLLIVAMGDRILATARRWTGQRAWAGITALLGAAFLFAALSRLHTI